MKQSCEHISLMRSYLAMYLHMHNVNTGNMQFGLGTAILLQKGECHGSLLYAEVTTC